MSADMAIILYSTTLQRYSNNDQLQLPIKNNQYVESVKRHKYNTVYTKLN